MTTPLCTRCHQPQAAHLRLAMAKGFDWDFVLVCPSGTWQAPQEVVVEKPKPLVIDGIPRRNRVDRWSPGEHAINDLLWKIERLGAHVYLTDVVNFLQQAQARLADWVERPGAPDGPWPAEWQAPQELDVPVRHDTGTAEAVQGRTVERLHADSTPESLATQLAAMTAERDEARAWVKDLHSGMYINCVYCGHRYGPKEDTPSSMADVLKVHVEQCPQHPMSALKAQLATVEAERDDARDQLAGCCACQHDGRGALTSECQAHQEQREAFAALRTALAQLSARCRDVSHWEHTMSVADCADNLDRLLREKETGR